MMDERSIPPGEVKNESTLENGLTQMQEMFCLEYVVDWDKKAATIRAGYSEKSASTIARDLYKNPKCRARINELVEERTQEIKEMGNRVIQEIARLAFADPTSIIKKLNAKNYTVKRLEDIPEGLRVAIKSLRPTKEGIAVQFHEKTTALDMLARHIGLYKEDNAQKVPEGPMIYLPDNNRSGTPQNEKGGSSL